MKIGIIWLVFMAFACRPKNDTSKIEAALEEATQAERDVGNGSKDPAVEPAADHGQAPSTPDCSPQDPLSFHMLSYDHRDKDLDGYTVATAEAEICSGEVLPEGYVKGEGKGLDCDDNDKTLFQFLTAAYRDADRDGYTVAESASVCSGSKLSDDRLLTAGTGADCDDTNPNVHTPANFYLYRDADLDGRWYRQTQSLCSASGGYGPIDTVKEASLESPNTAAMDADVDNDGTGDALDLCPGENDASRLTRYKLIDGDGDGASDSSASALVCPANTEYTLALPQVVTTDCAAGDATRWQNLNYTYRDSDGDGSFVASNGTRCSGAALSSGYANSVGLGLDCDDTNSAYHSVITYFRYTDSDNDLSWYREAQDFCIPTSGFGLADASHDANLESPNTAAADDDADNDGNRIADDCDDTNPLVWQYLPYTYRDADSDGYNIAQSGMVCSGSSLKPGHYQSNSGSLDCDDTDSERYVMSGYSYVDEDFDGYYAAGSGMQCASASALPMGFSNSSLSLWGTAQLDTQNSNASNLLWQERQRFPTGNQLQATTTGGGLLVAVGTNGTILTSTNATSWTPRTSGTANNLSGVAFGNSTYVAVGALGTALYSSDATSWTTATTPGAVASTSLNAVAYGNGLFVAVGSSGAIITSADGITWTSRSSGSGQNLNAITYGNSLFVAVGRNGVIVTSSNGVSWTVISTGSSSTFNGVAFGNSRYTVVGTGGVIYTSTNGSSWSSVTSGTSQSLYAVSYINSNFVIGGAAGTILTSSSGTSWTAVTSGTSNQLQAVAYFNSLYVAVGASGTVLTSSDLSSWTDRSSGSPNTLNGITYASNLFVAVGAKGTILTSGDGSTWAVETSGLANTSLNSVAYGNSIFVSVGAVGTILTSPDGVTWTSRSSGTPYDLNAVTFGNGLFIAVGQNWTILTSSDGMNWTARSTDVQAAFHAVTYGNGLYVIVGSLGTFLTSSDAINWNNESDPNSYSGTVYGVTYGNNRFVAAADAGKIWTSTDGVDWSERNSGKTTAFASVAYAHGIFVAVGATGGMTTSVDGFTWAKKNVGTNNNLSGIAFGNGVFSAVGQFGMILNPQ